jgi:hypothetical protein
MQVTIRGWSRDHGPKQLLSAELAYEDVRHGGGECEWKKTYIDVIRTERPPFRGRKRPPWHTVKVIGSAELNLNGGYMVELELRDREIARLFYLTHGAEEGRRALEALEEAARTLRAVYGNDAGDSAA